MTRPKGLFILVLFVVATATAGETASAESYRLEVYATDGANETWFEVAGYPGDNPTLSFGSGDQVDVRLENIGTERHNIHFDAPIDRAMRILDPLDRGRIGLEVPSGLDARLIEYWCDVHRDEGMWGWVLLGDDIDASGPGALLPHRDAPGPAPMVVLFGIMAAAMVLRRSSRIGR